MKHKLKLEPGVLYQLDATFANTSVVKLISVGEHFAKVRCLDTGTEWTTMRDRLTERKNKQHEERKMGNIELPSSD